MRVALATSIVISCVALAASVAGDRAAVVAVPHGQWMRVYIAYPQGVTEKEIRQDLATICDVGRLRLGQWEVSSSPASVVVVCHLRPTPESHRRSIPIWPFICALRRFDTIAIAYLGSATPNQGSMENQFVQVKWVATRSSINYTIHIKRRDFAGVSELTAELGPGAKQLPPSRTSSLWPSILLTILLALLAGAVTYWVVRRIVSPPSAATRRPTLP